MGKHLNLQRGIEMKCIQNKNYCTHTHTKQQTKTHNLKKEETERKSMEYYQTKITDRNARERTLKAQTTRKQKIKSL